MIHLKKIIKFFYPNPIKHAYYIGFWNEIDINLPFNDRYAKTQWINVGKYGKEGWFADPFIVSVDDDNIILFVEEMIYATGRGIIAKLVIDRHDMKIINKINLLELDTHLSFPIYFKEDGFIYVYPENYEGGGLKIYKYDEEQEKLLYIKDIIKEPLVDTQIVMIDGNYYAFGVKITTGFQSDTKRLLVFKSDELLGNYRLVQIIENDKCEERGAGRIYTDEKGRVIRPAQCCEGRYGAEVILYHLQLEDGKFKEKEIGRIEPDNNSSLGSVLHTFNHMKGLYVIDGFKWFYPMAKKIYCKLRGLE